MDRARMGGPTAPLRRRPQRARAGPRHRSRNPDGALRGWRRRRRAPPSQRTPLARDRDSAVRRRMRRRRAHALARRPPRRSLALQHPLERRGLPDHRLPTSGGSTLQRQRPVVPGTRPPERGPLLPASRTSQTRGQWPSRFGTASSTASTELSRERSRAAHDPGGGGVRSPRSRRRLVWRHDRLLRGRPGAVDRRRRAGRIGDRAGRDVRSDTCLDGSSAAAACARGLPAAARWRRARATVQRGPELPNRSKRHSWGQGCTSSDRTHRRRMSCEMPTPGTGILSSGTSCSTGAWAPGPWQSRAGASFRSATRRSRSRRAELSVVCGPIRRSAGADMRQPSCPSGRPSCDRRAVTCSTAPMRTISRRSVSLDVYNSARWGGPGASAARHATRTMARTHSARCGHVAGLPNVRCGEMAHSRRGGTDRAGAGWCWRGTPRGFTGVRASAVLRPTRPAAQGLVRSGRSPASCYQPKRQDQPACACIPQTCLYPSP